MMEALDALLTSHTHAVMHSMETRLAESSSRMASEVANLVEMGMRRAVHRMMEQELGGSMTPPDARAPDARAPVDVTQTAPLAPTAPPAPHHHHNPVPPSEDRERSLKVDVVGFEDGAQEKLVASAFSGEVDLRFIHPDKMSAFAPHRNRHVVMMIGRVPHGLAYKFKSAEVEPIITRRTPGHVIHAIEELQRSHGMQAA